ncbi:MAG: hypothetical protein H5U08_02055 [Thermogutta sp.]|uniref:hypothetical protein n=1 Tax=Thermogutta sp. TaxID=1962930 RepID=UPI0019933BD7|nr:hypothetical protein [Thermogutta sp.]MBC7351117.1 hypothetical protein [Thermogutta sp.]
MGVLRNMEHPVAQGSLWYIYRTASQQVVGPIPGGQVIQWLQSGGLSGTDFIGPSPNGPWSPLRDWSGAQVASVPPAGPPAPASTSIIGHRPGSPLAADPEFLRKQRQRARERAKKITYFLIGSIAVLFVLFLVVLTQPLTGIFGSKSKGKTSAQPPKLEDPAAKLASTASADLQELLGPLETNGDHSAASGATGGALSQNPVERLAEASRAFGGSPEKLRDAHDGIEVRVQGLEIAPLRVRLGDRSLRTRTPYLLIRIRIANQTGDRFVTYTPAHSGPPTATLTWPGNADLLHPYWRQGYEIEGQQRSPVRLGPGEVAMDVYAFAVPPESTDHVVLTLPGAALGTKEDFVFMLAVDKVNRPEQANGATTEAGAEEDTGIGPLSRAEAPSNESGNTALPEEEALPIPGIHDAAGTDRSAMSENELRQQEELRRKAEAMQEVLDRQREKARATGTQKPTRRR